MAAAVNQKPAFRLSAASAIRPIVKAIGIGVCRDVPGLQGHIRRHISR